ncbi:putative UPF0481 protein At3g02645 [Solanum stenotomum]|uniref:putative UPF0481 protein At3g02645 n=1 Tax=Solanum stenotomum TaxID=172797 RepID=UPI0020D00B68|nr:putative UPF0481 protein At3g02645 [Solanum stenotomum]XP_049392334.1 putative UPF0481 protein At3g02645 [Solanum stenotomum]XP_049392335.1 putative UPF0481 protein At3g02645 [Solanum stenotomum]XP_049392336.1 putative UPF0481 protein At3g02645 [Solanum stenotomum]XP_049392337.1 putative UPF0481 protein At3g02645 [Solanum stenotomum]
MEHSIDIISTDDQIPLPLQTEIDEIEEGREVHQLSDTNDEDPSGSQTKKCVNQIFDKMFEDLDKSSFKSCTIFKVNVRLRESNPDAYTPKMVSIGPYHRKNAQLRPMEKYKLLYLRRFLKRSEEFDVKYWISMLEYMKEEALMCYDDIEYLDTDDNHEFCKMLLLDGCFVVEFIRECFNKYAEDGEDRIINFVDYKYNQILRDLLLLENQLPFFILDRLHSLTAKDDEPLEKLAITLFSQVVNLGYMSEYGILCLMNLSIYGFERRDMKHLLQVVHLVSCPINFKKSSNNNDTKWNKVMPNATELSEAGVRFTKVNYTSLFYREFANGLMTIPSLDVVDGTETLLRNFIAYEQQSIDLQYLYFSDYAIFMDQLIDTDKDVSLLRRKGIIANWIGEDKEVASLFNKMGNGVTVYSNFYYKEVFTKAVKHCDEKPWNRMKASLKHNYFSSPWVGASTMTVIILLILTTIQTILAIISAFK